GEFAGCSRLSHRRPSTSPRTRTMAPFAFQHRHSSPESLGPTDRRRSTSDRAGSGPGAGFDVGGVRVSGGEYRETPRSPPHARDPPPMPASAEKDLLFGLLALQNGLIDQSKLVAAFRRWTLDKGRPLAEHLVGRGDLDADDRAAIDALVARHLKKH